MRFDDRSVNRIYIPKYSRNSQYPQYVEIPYPKAGVEDNPLVRLYVWSTRTNRTVIAEPPADLTSTNQSYYIFSNSWINMPANVRRNLGDERLMTVWANREQNIIYITLCNEIDCVLVGIPEFASLLRQLSTSVPDSCSVVHHQRPKYVGRTNRREKSIHIWFWIFYTPSACLY
ncbi:hypothetical protein OESDEN_24943 [Oesophagostomum dentatum]|uniref:Dipeptidylpeptidase IV N-terminal domain-containing protein n=1 Tax=Oesophagostomum dentatum TaxID=61180 RepID=A0A0B1RUX6_OESDE|nr:hypothetical protein OESDEN_24943 [Oesophagostomum dentatum]